MQVIVYNKNITIYTCQQINTYAYVYKMYINMNMEFDPIRCGTMPTSTDPFVDTNSIHPPTNSTYMFLVSKTSSAYSEKARYAGSVLINPLQSPSRARWSGLL